jgi:hypothetical protein
MTVCIAAISRKDNRIVTASDFMLSNEYMSADTRTIKGEPVGRSGKWLAMFSGNPSVQAVVLKLANENLSADKSETSTEVLAAIENAFRETLKRKIDAELLSPYGIDRETFLQRGQAWLGEREFSDLLYQLRTTRLETSFLVAGFEPNQQPRIFSVTDPGVSQSHDSIGFHAIGSGNLRALGSLFTTYDYDAELTTDQLVYRVCEAKFLSESALGVGKRTIINIVDSDGKHEGLFPELVDKVRNIWSQKGRPPIPDEGLRVIQQSRHEIRWNLHKPPLSKTGE